MLHEVSSRARPPRCCCGTPLRPALPPNWSSITAGRRPAEVAALNVLKAGLEAKGDTWTDLAIPHDTGANVTLDQPGDRRQSAQRLHGTPTRASIRDLHGQGLSIDLTAVFDRQRHHREPARAGASRRSRSTARSSRSRRRSISTAWSTTTWTSPRRPASIPPAWTSLDAMFADFDKIKAAGFIPLADRRPALPGRLSDPRAASRRSPAPTSTTASTAPSSTRRCSTSPELPRTPSTCVRKFQPAGRCRLARTAPGTTPPTW